MRYFGALLALAGILGLACSSTSSTKLNQSCTPGIQQACACLGSTTGIQTCKTDGTGFNACVCADGGSAGSGTGGVTQSGGNGGQAVNGGSSSGGSNTGGSGGATGQCSVTAITDNIGCDTTVECAQCASDNCCAEWEACRATSECEPQAGAQSLIGCIVCCIRANSVYAYSACRDQCVAVQGVPESAEGDALMRCLLGDLDAGGSQCQQQCF
jgi:hypothetical protein